MRRSIQTPLAGIRRVQAGDLLYLTRLASPQFTRPITVRVIRPLTDRRTCSGWLWIEAYELSPTGGVGEARELYVCGEGLRWATAPALAVWSTYR
ncbi:hypothetical protein [Micromonospora vulcania]|uniref:Uncharacterized protein n=1 Tax=Micromonospora vulcania TaxID=1441873 RepID=A0ABW1H825_9ACTN